jgi:nucleoside-diphosphate-sugar epimerase
MRRVTGLLLLVSLWTGASSFVTPCHTARRRTVEWCLAATPDDDDDASRYQAQAARLRDQIRQMEADLGPTRKRSYEDTPSTIPAPEEEAGRTLRGKKILVAGANGRLGSMVCRYLLRNHPQTQVVAAVHYVGENSMTARGYGRLAYEVGAEDGVGSIGPAWSSADERVATFTYDGEVMQDYNLQNLRIVDCEFLDPVQCSSVMEGCDAVIYCATDFNGNSPRAVSGLNVAFLFRAVARPDKGRVEVEGVQNMLSALRLAQLDRKRMTGRESPASDPINFVLVSAEANAFENTETPFGSFYGIKQRGEELMKEDFPSVTSTVLRLGRFDDNFVQEDLDVVLSDVSEEETDKRRLINRRDAARAVVDALTKEELVGKTVDVWTASR